MVYRSYVEVYEQEKIYEWKEYEEKDKRPGYVAFYREARPGDPSSILRWGIDFDVNPVGCDLAYAMEEKGKSAFKISKTVNGLPKLEFVDEIINKLKDTRGQFFYIKSKQQRWRKVLGWPAPSKEQPEHLPIEDATETLARTIARYDIKKWRSLTRKGQLPYLRAADHVKKYYILRKSA